MSLKFMTAETGYGAATADDVVRKLWSNPKAGSAMEALVAMAHERGMGRELETVLSMHLPTPKGPHPTATVSREAAGYAIVRQGRWVVLCPWCPSAEYAHHSDPRFFCVECGNAAVGGKWIGVEWIENPEEVEAQLLQRPSPYNQCWEWGESIGDLVMENVENGVSRLVIARELPQ